MTFTKGVGSPTYMAPEVLEQQHYKFPADIYSFGIAMLEVMIWSEAYPKDKFRFPWMIAEAVVNGKRPDTIKQVDHRVEMVIKMCWEHEPSFRPQMKEVIERLEKILQIL